MQITITHNFPQVQMALNQLRTDIAEKAMASALNKVIAQAKTAMKREIVAEFNIAPAKVEAALRINKAVAGRGQIRMQASLESPSKRGRSLNLINFVEKSVSLAQARKRSKAGTLNQLFVQIKRRGGKKALGSAFIGNKGRTVFVREGKSRLPIKAMQTIDVAQMFNAKRINAKVVQLIREKFPDVFANEARFYTNKFNGKS